MSFQQSNKILLLSDHHRAAIPIHSTISPLGLSIEEKNMNLHFLDTIRKAIKATQNTTFLRTELLKFIKTDGYPFMIMMDYTINSGLDEVKDPDHMKLLRTFLISYIILMRGTQFENLRGNFILLVKQDQLPTAQLMEQNPAVFLDRLKTKDPQVNTFIDEYKNDNNSFMKKFFIKVLQVDTSPNDISSTLNNYITAIKARSSIQSKQENKAAGTTHDTSVRQPADILYRLDDTRVYASGEVRALQDDESLLEQNQFYIKGYWTSTTQKDVANALNRAIKTKCNDTVVFNPEKELIFNCDEACITDASTCVSLTQLTGNELIDFKNIQIMVSPKNKAILENAAGYGLIQKFVRELI
jgi:hypothetical protein